MAATTKATKKTAAPKAAKSEEAAAVAAAPVKKAPAAKKTHAQPTAQTEKVTAEELRAQGADGRDPKMAGIRLHGKQFVGKVISDKANKTVTVEWERRRLISKYERYEKRYSRVYAHNPITINAKLGDTVMIQETRPLSKTKNFVVIEIVKRADALEAVEAMEAIAKKAEAKKESKRDEQ
jgi:small subunit ribosomal protein S17